MKLTNEKDELNALMDLEIARKEAIHYISMGTDTFAISKGCIEIRRKGGEEPKDFRPEHLKRMGVYIVKGGEK